MGLLQLWRVLDLQPRHSHLKSSVAIGSFGSGLGWTGFPGTLASFGTGIAKSVSCARLRKLERTLAPHGQTIPGALYVSSHNPTRRRSCRQVQRCEVALSSRAVLSPHRAHSTRCCGAFSVHCTLSVGGGSAGECCCAKTNSASNFRNSR